MNGIWHRYLAKRNDILYEFVCASGEPFTKEDEPLNMNNMI